MRSSIRWIMPTALLVLTQFAPPTAQAQVPVQEGKTVRFAIGDSAMVTGILFSVSSDAWTLTLGNGQVRPMTPTDVTAVEVWVRRRNTGKGALIGGGIGLVIGGVTLLGTRGENFDDSRDPTGGLFRRRV